MSAGAVMGPQTLRILYTETRAKIEVDTTSEGMVRVCLYWRNGRGWGWRRRRSGIGLTLRGAFENLEMKL